MSRWFVRYRWPLIGFVLALGMNLWHLNTPPQLVSDEISFVQDGQAYLQHRWYFDPHPPLGKELIGASIALFGDQPTAWRLTSAFMGALIVPLLWFMVWGLTQERRAANLVLLLGLMDGLRLVDARLGLINTTYIAFGLLAVVMIIGALRSSRWLPWLIGAGVCTGLAIATKWLAALMIIPAVVLWLQPQWFGLPTRERHRLVFHTIWCFGLLPILIYIGAFAIHFAWLHLPNTFFGLNVDMLNYHLTVPSTGDPQQLTWLNWPMFTVPFRYLYQAHGDQIRMIQSLPNPWLWWTGILAALISLWSGWKQPMRRGLNMFVLWAWIPFLFIQRIMYSYHAMMLDLWLLVVVAVGLSRAWPKYRRVVYGYIVVAMVVFLWFLPWYVNLPMSANQHRLRQWLPTWSVQP